MLLNITGSNKKNRKLVERAAWWYAEKLMGKRLMSGLEIYIKPVSYTHLTLPTILRV